MAEQRFKLGDWLVEPHLNRLTSEGRQVSLQLREMEVLVYLATHSGDIVTADQLIDEVWKTVTVAQDSVYVAVSRIRKALDDTNGDSTYIETIPKRGYRLVAPVEFIDSGDSAERPIKKDGLSIRSRLAVVLSLAVIIASALFYETPAPVVPESPVQSEARSIAVMAFLDLSPDGSQEYLGDGFSEELLNRLAGASSLRVMARTSSFSFKGKSSTAQEIGAALGVTTILEGSINRDGERIHVNAQLIDATNGFHIWSESFDRPMDDIRIIQDEITRKIINELSPVLGEADAVSTTATTNPEAYIAYLLGVQQMEKRGVGPLAMAAEQFEAALAIDPDYAPAMARLSMTYVLLPGYDFRNYPRPEMTAKALPLAEKALALAPNLPEAQAAMGYYLWNQSKYLAAKPYFTRALELNPSYGTVQVWLATLNSQLGRYDAHLEMLEAAVQIDPLSFLAVLSLADAYFARKMFEKLRPLLERLKSMRPQVHRGFLADILMTEGRSAEAGLLVLEALAIDKNSRHGHERFAVPLLTNRFGLYEEVIRFDRFQSAAQLLAGGNEEIKSTLKFFEGLAVSSSSRFRALTGAAYLVAGDPAKARQHLEAVWNVKPGQPDLPKIMRRIGHIGTLSLIQLKQQAGEADAAREVIDLSLSYLDDLESANMTSLEDIWWRGMLYLYSGRTREGLITLQQAIDGNYAPEFIDYYLMKQFPNLDFAPIMARFEALRDVERDKFLIAVCNDGNPAPEVWTPLPQTCEGYATKAAAVPSANSAQAPKSASG